MKSLTGTVDTGYQQKYATDPIYFIVVKWPTTSFTISGFNAGEIPYFGRPMSSPYQLGSNRIVSIGNLEESVNVDGTVGIGNIKFTLQDFDGHIQDYLKLYNITGVAVDFRMHYGTLSDAVTLFTGFISADVVWNEDSRTFEFTIDSLTTFEGVIGRNMQSGNGLWPAAYMDADKKNTPWQVFIGNSPMAGTNDGTQNIAPAILNFPDNVTSPAIAGPITEIKKEPRTNTTTSYTSVLGVTTPNNDITVKDTSTFPNTGTTSVGLAIKGEYTGPVDLKKTANYQRTHPTLVYDLYVYVPDGQNLNDTNLGKVFVNFVSHPAYWVENYGYWDGSSSLGNTNKFGYPIEVLSWTQHSDYPNYYILKLIIPVANIYGCPSSLLSGTNVYVRGLPYNGTLTNANCQLKQWSVANFAPYAVGSTAVRVNPNPDASTVAAWQEWGGSINGANILSMSTSSNEITLSTGINEQIYPFSEFYLRINVPESSDTNIWKFAKGYKLNATQFRLTLFQHTGWTVRSGAEVVLCLYPTDWGNSTAEESIIGYRGSYIMDRHVLDQNPFSGTTAAIVFGISGVNGQKNYGKALGDSWYVSRVRHVANGLGIILKIPPEIYANSYGYSFAGDLGWYEYSRTSESPVANFPKKFASMLKTFLSTYLPPSFVTFDSSWTSDNAYSNTQQTGCFIATDTDQRIWDIASRAAFEQCCALVASGSTLKLRYLIESSTPTLSTSTSFNGIITLGMIEDKSMKLLCEDTINKYTMFKGVSAQWAQASMRDWAKNEVYHEILDTDLRSGTISGNATSGGTVVPVTGFASGRSVVGRLVQIQGSPYQHTITSAVNPTQPTSITISPGDSALTSGATGRIVNLLPDTTYTQGYKEYPKVEFLTTCAMDMMIKCVKFWANRIGNSWKKLQFKVFYTALPVELFDIVQVELPENNLLGANVTSTKARVVKKTINPTDHSIELVVETPYKVGSTVIDTTYWTGPA